MQTGPPKSTPQGTSPSGSPPHHSLTVGEVLASFRAADERGLDGVEAEGAGPGPGRTSSGAKPPSMWRRFLGQFLEPVIGILIVAASSRG